MSTTTAPAVRSFAPADLAYVAVFAALIAALALTPAIPIGTLGVPITLQTLGVALAGLCLGAWRGAAAVALYLMVGGRAGLAVLVGPTGGYLIGFLLSAFAVGLVAQWAVRRGLNAWTPVLFFAGVFAARVLIIWPLGVAGIARAVGKPISEIWLSDLAFWPGDILKAVVASVIAFAMSFTRRTASSRGLSIMNPAIRQPSMSNNSSTPTARSVRPSDRAHGCSGTANRTTSPPPATHSPSTPSRATSTTGGSDRKGGMSFREVARNN